MIVLDDLNGPLATGDRFAGAGKVIIRIVSGLLTGTYGPLDRLLKASPLTVAEHGLQIARAPVFRAMRVGQLQVLERFAAESGQLIVAHGRNSLLIDRNCFSKDMSSLETLWLIG